MKLLQTELALLKGKVRHSMAITMATQGYGTITQQVDKYASLALYTGREKVLSLLPRGLGTRNPSLPQ